MRRKARGHLGCGRSQRCTTAARTSPSGAKDDLSRNVLSLRLKKSCVVRVFFPAVDTRQSTGLAATRDGVRRKRGGSGKRHVALHEHQ